MYLFGIGPVVPGVLWQCYSLSVYLRMGVLMLDWPGVLAESWSLQLCLKLFLLPALPLLPCCKDKSYTIFSIQFLPIFGIVSLEGILKTDFCCHEFYLDHGKFLIKMSGEKGWNRKGAKASSLLLLFFLQTNNYWGERNFAWYQSQKLTSTSAHGLGCC